MSSNNPKDFSIVEIQPKFYMQTYLTKTNELRTKIKKAIDRGEISLREINEDGDVVEESSMISLKNLVGFTIQLSSGVTQIMQAGVDPDETDTSEEDEEKPMFAFVRSENYNGWTIGKMKKSLNNVEISKADYVVVRSEFAKVVENTTDNYITASLDWIIETVIEDFEDMFPDSDTEEFDDGE